MLNHEPAVTYSHIPLQPASVDIWDEKYRLRANDGTPVEDDIDGTYRRVAKALAKPEKPHLREKYEKLFYDALKMGATGAGRIMSNAGAEEHKTAVSLINCTVSSTIGDSMEQILQANKEAGLTLKAGCGIGYEFSTIRPNGAHVNGAGAATSGPLPFMDIFDRTCATVKSAGARRGAQMGTFDVSHPDAPDFIRAKREDGRLRNFNLSLLITDEFIQAVQTEAIWEFKWEGKPFYRTNHETGEKIKAEMPAIELWNLIMQSTYDYAEPGFLLIDRINQYNNLWFVEHLRATNPCGEQPLPPYGSCLLGSILATMFVVNPFTPEAYFDWDKYYSVCRLFARMLDNVVEANNLPLEQQRHEIEHKRRHGMGFFGAGSAMVMLGMKYGSPESIAFTDELSKQMAYANYEEGAMLAKEKGEAPVLKKVYTQEEIADHVKYNRNFTFDFSGPGQKAYTGRELFLKSHYFDAFREDEEGRRILALLEEHGCRYSHATSIAPTGTISFSFGNNCSNGIEPSFTHHYSRNVIRPGRKTKEAVEVYSYEYLLYKSLVDKDAKPIIINPDLLAERAGLVGGELTKEEIMAICKENHVLPPEFADTSTLTPKEHVDVQAAAQKWVDSSISKTINIDTNYPFEDFKDVYMYAYSKGLKGCTTFRYNPEAFTGVLVKMDDLANTKYTFNLADGTSIEVSGDTLINYDGGQHTASNLADALKEGLYGRM
jgi:ribonucleoside-diphosphate reductase alpha chain